MSRACVLGSCIPTFIITLGIAVYLLVTFHQDDIEMNTSGRVIDNSECSFSVDDGTAATYGNLTVQFWPPNVNSTEMVMMIVPADQFCNYQTVYTCCSNYLNRVVYFDVEVIENGLYQVVYMSTKLTYNNRSRETIGSLFAIGACISFGSIVGYLLKTWDDARRAKLARVKEVSSSGVRLDFGSF